MLSLATISMSLLALAPSHAIRALKNQGEPVQANKTYQDLLDPLDRCGRHTTGMNASQVGVDIVHRLWKSNGENCRYATRQFRNHAEERLRIKFPYNCRDNGVFDANRVGRGAGENYLNRIIRDCFPDRSPTPSTGSEFGNCGKYTAGTIAAQAAVNLVHRLWRSNGEDCRYATRQFSSDAESALLVEFPDRCMVDTAFVANRLGRRAGEHYLNHVITECSQGVPLPTQPPGSDLGYCGKYTAGTEAAQVGVDIVHQLWKSSGEDCRYATRQFSSDTESALLDQFPDICRDNGAFDANRAGRGAGENYLSRVIKECSQPAPRPAPSPTEGSSDDVEAKQ